MIKNLKNLYLRQIHKATVFHINEKIKKLGLTDNKSDCNITISVSGLFIGIQYQMNCY